MVNDMTILYSIMAFFIILGGLLPFVQEDFNQDQIENQYEPFTDDMKQKAESVSTTNAFTVLLSVVKMFFWTFGDLPFVIDLVIFIPLRLVFLLVIVRNIWIGGGG